MCAIIVFELFSRCTKGASTMCSTTLSDLYILGVVMAKRTQSMGRFCLYILQNPRKKSNNSILVLNTSLHEKQDITWNTSLKASRK